MATKRSVSRREFLRMSVGGALGIAGVAMLAACAPEAAPPKPGAPTAAPAKPAAPGKLVVWAYQSFTPDGDKLLGQQTTDFGKANNFEVEYVALENKVVPEKLAAAVEAKTPPDVQMFTAYTLLHFYKGGGHLVDVTDVWDKVSKLEGGFFESVPPVFRAEGKYWGIPFETASSPMFTRLDLVEKATGKREPPKTLDELTDVCKKILKPPDMHPLGMCLGRVPDAFGDTQTLIWAEGGSLVDKNGKPSLNTPEVIATLKRIEGWWKDKLIPPDSPTWDDTGNNKAYQSKLVTFVFNPPSIYWWLGENDKELLNNTAMAARPAGKGGGGYTGIDAWAWSVFKLSKNVDGAKALIEYLMDPKRLQAVYEKVGGRWYPIHKNLQKHEYWTSKPHFKYYPDLVASGRAMCWPAEPSPKILEGLGEVYNQMLLADMTQDVVVKGKKPEEAAAEANKRMETIFKKYGLA